jgi:hypothetical protein
MAKENLYEQLTRLHRYMGINEAGLPAAVKQKVGNVLFGQSPQVAQLQGKRPEPNTDFEDDLYKHLRSWTTTSTDSSSATVLSSVKELQYLARYFPKILQPPMGSEAFRGTSVHLGLIGPWIKKNPRYEAYSGGFLRFTTPFPYKPRRAVSSWSTAFYFASFFQGNYENPANIPVVFQTQVDNSFIMNPKATNLIFKGDLGADMDQVRDEDEVIKTDPNGQYFLIISKEEYQNLVNPRPFDFDRD